MAFSSRKNQALAWSGRLIVGYSGNSTFLITTMAKAMSSPSSRLKSAPNAVDALLDALISDKPDTSNVWSPPKLKDTLAGQKILALKPEDACVLVRALLPRLREVDRVITAEHNKNKKKASGGWTPSLLKNQFARNRYLPVLDALFVRKLPFEAADLLAIFETLRRGPVFFINHFPKQALIRTVEHFVQDHAVDPKIEASLKWLRPRLGVKKLEERVDSLCGIQPAFRIVPGEAWSDQALADLGKIKGGRRQAWNQLVDHCHDVTGGKPSPKWLQETNKLINNIGLDAYKNCLARWFTLVDKRRTQHIELFTPASVDENLLIIEPHANILRGLAWSCGLFDDRDLTRALEGLAVSAYKKVPGIGPRLVKVGNACVWALGAIPGMEGVGQLSLLKVKVKFGTAQRGIEKALTVTAERVGLPRDELEEMAVPAYGLTEVGRSSESFGDYTARLDVAGDGSSQLVWIKSDGKSQKSVPAAVTQEHGDELKELKAAAKDIQKMLPAQRERLDSLYRQQKNWPIKTWRERYLDHPLVGILARRLVWEFGAGKKSASGIFHDGRLVSSADRPLDLKAGTTVSLWHPIGHSTDEVVAWRTWLERREVRQPFKQAHREVYVLTEAERNSRVYSNRFAAHILKQHQFNALCAARGWRNKLRLMVDDTYPPASVELAPWGLRAEFWIEGAGDEYGEDTNETGTFLYLTTDQVRFYARDAAQLHVHASGGGYRPGYQQAAAEPVALDHIPPLVFSEVMRDVDLFVGVASVGNDPNWSDGGPQGRYRNYWEGYAFGELSATARTRREVLERVIPRLKIAQQCSFTDKFLVVKGQLRTYKIHLGSGNILMSPNDQYLCIVPKQSTAGDVKMFLPFEGDQVMSVIISKAFLLAEDVNIKDPTITSQIGRR